MRLGRCCSPPLGDASPAPRAELTSAAHLCLSRAPLQAPAARVSRPGHSERRPAGVGAGRLGPLCPCLSQPPLAAPLPPRTGSAAAQHGLRAVPRWCPLPALWARDLPPLFTKTSAAASPPHTRCRGRVSLSLAPIPPECTPGPGSVPLSHPRATAAPPDHRLPASAPLGCVLPSFLSLPLTTPTNPPTHQPNPPCHVAQVEISRWFGPLESTFYKHPMSPHPDVFRVSNDPAQGCTGERGGWGCVRGCGGGAVLAPCGAGLHGERLGVLRPAASVPPSRRGPHWMAC